MKEHPTHFYMVEQLVREPNSLNGPDDTVWSYPYISENNAKEMFESLLANWQQNWEEACPTDRVDGCYLSGDCYFYTPTIRQVDFLDTK